MNSNTLEGYCTDYVQHTVCYRTDAEMSQLITIFRYDPLPTQSSKTFEPYVKIMTLYQN